MGYIILLIISILIVFNYLYIKDKLSKIVIIAYVSWWGLWLILSTFNLYSLYAVKPTTYALLVLNIVMFTVGFWICGKLSKNRASHVMEIKEEISGNHILSKMLIGVFGILLYYWLRYLNIVREGVSLNNRLERFNVGYLFTSTAEILFFNYFIESFVYAFIIILAYMVIYGQFKNYMFVLLVGCIFLYSGIGGSRGILVDVIIAMAFILVIRSLHNKINVKILVALSAIVLIISFYLAWLTASRLGFKEINVESIAIGWETFLKQGIVYYTGPFRALDYGLIEYPDIIGFQFGRATFAGIDEIIIMGFRILGVELTTMNATIGKVLQETQLIIGENEYFNFAYTNVMIHYFDFGVIGVVIFPFIYGFFVRKAIFLYQNMPVIPTMIILVFLFNTMINSVFKWGLQSPASVFLLSSCFVWYICLGGMPSSFYKFIRNKLIKINLFNRNRE